MSLPTAHNYIIEELKNNIDSIQTDFLKPKVLVQHLSKIESTLRKDIDNLDTEDFSRSIDQDQKKDLSKIIEKIIVLEKSANQKIKWATEFSRFLKIQSDSK